MLVCFLLLPVVVVAQSMPDVVRLNDGSFVRGTVVERIEGDHVTIQSVTGELRTFALADVAYAGVFPEPGTESPVAEPAPVVEPAEPVEGPRLVAVHHRVEVSTDQPGLRVYVESGAAVSLHSERFEVGMMAEHQLLCIAPCVTELPSGNVAVSLAFEGGAPLAAGTVSVDHDLSMAIHLDDRSPLRGLGAGLLFAGSVPGLLFLTMAMISGISGQTDMGFLGVGIAAASVALGGLPLIAWGDTRQVEVR